MFWLGGLWTFIIDKFYVQPRRLWIHPAKSFLAAGRLAQKWQWERDRCQEAFHVKVIFETLRGMVQRESFNNQIVLKRQYDQIHIATQMLGKGKQTTAFFCSNTGCNLKQEALKDPATHFFSLGHLSGTASVFAPCGDKRKKNDQGRCINKGVQFLHLNMQANVALAMSHRGLRIWQHSAVSNNWLGFQYFVYAIALYSPNEPK